MIYKIERHHTILPQKIEGKWTRIYWTVMIDYFDTKVRFIKERDAKAARAYMARFLIGVPRGHRGKSRAAR